MGTPRAGYRGCALRSLWSLRPIILVDYRQPRALARVMFPCSPAGLGGGFAAAPPTDSTCAEALANPPSPRVLRWIFVLPGESWSLYTPGRA